MTVPVIITISGTQQFSWDEPETIQLVTQGTYTYEPGVVSFSYVETEMTGMEGVTTTFTIENGERVTLLREGKLRSEMLFVVGEKHEALYDAGFGGLLLGLRTKSMTALFNENGGILDLSYSIEVEHTACGTNSYHIEIRRA